MAALVGVLTAAALAVAGGNNIVNPTTGLCLDIYAPCIGGQEEDGCKRVEAKDIQQGAGMQAWRCHNEENQNFEVIGGRLRNKATGLCVDIRLPCRDGSEAEHCERGALQDVTQVTTLQMQPCLEGGNIGEQGSQIWDFLENGLIKHEDTGLCMDIRAHVVEGGARAEPEDVREESPIQIYSCHSEGNQLFDFEQGDLAEEVGDEVAGGGAGAAEEPVEAAGAAADGSTGVVPTNPKAVENLTTLSYPRDTTANAAANGSAVNDTDEVAAAAAIRTTTTSVASDNTSSTDEANTTSTNATSPTTAVPTVSRPTTAAIVANDNATTSAVTSDSTTAEVSTTDAPTNLSTTTAGATNGTAGGSTIENDATTAAANKTDPAVANGTGMNGTPSQDYFWYAAGGNNATNDTNGTANDTSDEDTVVDSDEFFELISPNLRRPKGLLPVRVALGAAGTCALAAVALIAARAARRGGGGGACTAAEEEPCLEAQGMMSSIE